jgi:hypothetical protein
MSMQFKPTVPEIKESEEIDSTQLIRMSSANLIRLKRAHKAEQMFVKKKFNFLLFEFYLLDQWKFFLKMLILGRFMLNQLNK